MNHRNRRSWVALTAIVALAAMVRGQHLGELSFNFDEAFCWKMIHFRPAEIWERCALDNHPPLYFYLLWAWSCAFGDSPLALRSLSVVLGQAAVVGAYLLVREITRARKPEGRDVGQAFEPDRGADDGRQAGKPDLRGRVFATDETPRAYDLPALAAAALVALSPLQVDWSQQARMGYAIGAALSVISCWLLLRALQAAVPRLRDFIWYALAAAALAYTHHFALFVVAAQFLYAVGWALQRSPARTQPHPRAGTRAVPHATRPHPEAEGVSGAARGTPPSACPTEAVPGHLLRRSGVSAFCLLPFAFALIAVLYLPWAPHLIRQREQVSRLFHTMPFTWDEVAKACYQTLAARWEDEPPSAAAAWGATAACLLPAAVMLAWGRGGLRLVGLCVLASFDGAICASIADRNLIQSRYFVFANVLLLCGMPALVAQMAAVRHSIVSPKRQRGTSPHAPRLRVGLPAGAALLALVVGMAWLCLAHAERREGFARRPGMMAAMAYLAEVRQPGEPVLVCNPLLQITAAAHAVDAITGGATNRAHPSPLPEGEGERAVENITSTGRARKPILPAQVLSKSTAFAHFQGTAVMREEDYLSPEQLARMGARRVWAIDAVDWIAPEWKLHLPRQWVDVSEAKFPEWAAAENCQIVVRCYEKRRMGGSEERKVESEK